MQNVQGDAAGKNTSLPDMLGEIKREGWCVPAGPRGSSQPDGRREVQKLPRKSFFVYSPPRCLQRPRYKGRHKTRFARAWQPSGWNVLSKTGNFPFNTLGLNLIGKDPEFPFPGVMPSRRGYR